MLSKLRERAFVGTRIFSSSAAWLKACFDTSSKSVGGQTELACRNPLGGTCAVPPRPRPELSTIRSAHLCGHAEQRAAMDQAGARAGLPAAGSLRPVAPTSAARFQDLEIRQAAAPTQRKAQIG